MIYRNKKIIYNFKLGTQVQDKYISTYIQYVVLIMLLQDTGETGSGIYGKQSLAAEEVQVLQCRINYDFMRKQTCEYKLYDSFEIQEEIEGKKKKNKPDVRACQYYQK